MTTRTFIQKCPRWQILSTTQHYQHLNGPAMVSTVTSWTTTSTKRPLMATTTTTTATVVGSDISSSFITDMHLSSQHDGNIVKDSLSRNQYKSYCDSSCRHPFGLGRYRPHHHHHHRRHLYRHLHHVHMIHTGNGKTWRKEPMRRYVSSTAETAASFTNTTDDDDAGDYLDRTRTTTATGADAQASHTSTETTSEGSDHRQLRRDQIVDAMASRIVSNVQHMLKLLDRHQDIRQDVDDGMVTTTSRNDGDDNDHDHDNDNDSDSSSYMRKWRQQLIYEKRRQQQLRHQQEYQRRLLRQINTGQDRLDRMGSVWDDALVQAGMYLYVHRPSGVVNDSNNDDANDANANDNNNIATINHRHVDDNEDSLHEVSSPQLEEPVDTDNRGRTDTVIDETKDGTHQHHHYYTPIFNFPFDGHGHLDEQCFLPYLTKHDDGDDDDSSSNDDILTSQFEGGYDDSTEPHRGDVQSDRHQRRRDKTCNDAIMHSICLLGVIDGDTWWRFEHRHQQLGGIDVHGESIDEFNDDGDGGANNDTNGELSKEALRHTDPLLDLLEEDPRRSISTLEANLALAYLTTMHPRDAQYSTKDISENILQKCIQVFSRLGVDHDTLYRDRNELDSGTGSDVRHHADETTYRILLKAYSGRLMAYSEAIKLAKRLILSHRTLSSSSSPGNDAVTSEVLYEGMKSCKIKMDLASAREMMNSVLAASDNDVSTSIRPSLGSIMIMMDMLKAQDCRAEALEFVDTLQAKQLLSQKGYDKVLLSLCGWPTHSRGGERNDLCSFYQEIMHRMEGAVMDKNNQCGLPVWIKLVDRLENTVKFDPSLWDTTIRAMKTVLLAYPKYRLNWKMTVIGLEAARLAVDAGMAASILNRQDQRASIPHRAFTAGLEICLEASDSAACDSIVESLQRVESDYPVGVLKELYGLMLLCYTKFGDAERAIKFLEHMTDRDMQPDDNLYGAVLHVVGSKGQHEHVRSLFHNLTTPGVASYDAFLLSCIRSMSWDEADELYEKMLRENVAPSPQSIQAIMLAKLNQSGKDAVVAVLESLLGNKAAVFDENSFRLCSKILFREIPESLDVFRQELRGDKLHGDDNGISGSKLNLIRSIRVAEVESNRAQGRRRKGSNHAGAYQKNGQEEWKIATQDLLTYVKELEK